MLNVLQRWYERHFSNPQVAILALLLLAGLAFILVLGDVLAPVLASAVLAYLLEGLVGKMNGWGIPRIWAVLMVFTVFLAAFLVTTFGIAPLASRQLTAFFNELPDMVVEGKHALMQLPQKHPGFVTVDQINSFMLALGDEVRKLGQYVVTLSLSSVVGVATFLVYLILIPFMVFFMLKDKELIVKWFSSFLPGDMGLVSQVWKEVDIKIANYIRGKFMEIVIVWAVTFILFVWLGINYAMLLSLMVGFSVLIPYVGAALATLPIAAVAYLQWGLTDQFWYVMVAYAILQFLDGNVLVPLLFSEVVNLHPVAIIVAVLFFGGIWGLWGVFFAIPLATLIQAVINAWPRMPDSSAQG